MEAEIAHEELEQYGRLNSMRFHNVKIPDGAANTDEVIVKLCEEKLNVKIDKDNLQYNKTKSVTFSDLQFDLALNCIKTYFLSIILYCHIARMDTNSLQFPISILLLLCLDIHPNPGQITDYVSIFHLNIRSLRNKIAYLCDIASDYDIVCVTESHLDDSISNNDIHIDGFYPNPLG